MALERYTDGSTFVSGTHIYFRNLGPYWGGVQHKTNQYDVFAKADNFFLGRISWFARWRKYVFEPGAATVFEETCLSDITQFIIEETKAQKDAAKAQKAAKAAKQ